MPTTTPFNNLITFSRGSNATVTGSNGLIQWAPNNLLTFSEQFDNAAWTKTAATVTANNAVAPDGTQTADTLTDTATNARHIAFQTLSYAANTIYTVSAAIKQSSLQFAYLGLAFGTPAYGVVVDLATGLITDTRTNGTGITNASASVSNLGNGWYRIAVTAACTSGTNIFPIIATSNSGAPIYDANGQPSYAGSGQSIFIWGAQLELGSTATTYNPTTVKNLLGFSEAFDNAGWSKTRASIVTGAAANPVNGLFNAQKLMVDTTAAATHSISQDLTPGASVPVTASVYVKAAEYTTGRLTFTALTGAFPEISANFNLVAGTVTTSAGGGATVLGSSITPLSNGWYRVSISGFTGLSGFHRFGIFPNTNSAFTGDGNSGVYIYGAQLSDSASLDPYVPTPGAAPSSTAFYGPRFDFDPVTLQPRGLLVEEQRTNLLLRSEEFNNASWGKTDVTVTADTTTSPDGTADADSYVEGTAGTASITQNFTGTANATFTGTIYVKRVNTDWVRLTLLETAAATNRIMGWFNLSTGAVGSFTNGGTGSGATGSVSDAGNGWYRIRLTGAVNNSATALSLSLTSASADNSTTRVNNAEYRLYGAQLEVGAFATSYIPTVASTVTRSADVATITGQNFAQWFGPAAGTFAIDVLTAPGLRTGGGVQGLFSVNDGTTSNVMNAGRLATRLIRFNGTGSPAGDVSSVATAPDGTLAKVASAYAVNDWALSLNGATAVTDTSAVVPTVTRFGIGSLDGLFDPSAQWGGHIRSIRFIPARAADFQLQGLTT